MKLRLLLIGMSLFPFISFAQTPDTASTLDTLPAWEMGGTGNLQLNQATFVNWAAGGENSFSATALGHLYLNYRSDKFGWLNDLKGDYGLLRSGHQALIKKTSDNIEFNTRLNYDISPKWQYSGLMNFQTQFTEGFNYPDDSTVISDFMAPAYLVMALGLNYEPLSSISLMLAPVSGKMTFVLRDDLANKGAFGVRPAEYNERGEIIRPGQHVRKEVGPSFTGTFEDEVAENVHLFTKLELFSNYFHNPQNIDISWETSINLKVNDYITASVYTQLLYDDDIDIPTYEMQNGKRVQVGAGPKTQFKETLGIGLSYDF